MGNSENILVKLTSKENTLQDVSISFSKKGSKTFMEKVIANKEKNNPSRFHSYSYQRYTRNELDMDKIDYKNAKGNGIKSLMLKTYASLDSNAMQDKELPIYFKEILAHNYHSTSPKIERENIIAEKN